MKPPIPPFGGLKEEKSMSKDGYYGDFANAEEEERAMIEYERQTSEPDVVPCASCGNSMYQVNIAPENNLCDDCLAKMVES